MPYDLIHTSLNDGILTITLNRPKVKNAMSSEMMEEITFALNEAAANDEVLFAVLTGAGDYYCSGFDLKAGGFENQTVDEMLEYRIRVGKAMMAAFIDFPKMLIAIVNGPSVGAAFTTLALCDIAFCTTNATFWAPFSALGLCAEGCSSYLFPRIMGIARANNVLQFGRKLSATEAKEYGLIADIYKPEEIETVLWPKIRQMKESLSYEALLANKMLMRKWDKETLHKVNEAEWKELENRFVSEDFINAILKFMSGNKKKENKL